MRNRTRLRNAGRRLLSAGGAAASPPPPTPYPLTLSPDLWLPFGPARDFTDAGASVPCGDGDLIRVAVNAGTLAANATQGTSANRPTLDGAANAGLFDGVNDFLALASPGVAPAIPFSLSIWLKFTTTANCVVLEQNGNNGFSVQVIDGTALCNVGGGGQGVQSGGAINNDAWHHVAVVVSAAGTGKIYVDGADVTTVLGTGPQAPDYGAGTPLYLGSRGGSFAFPGSADQVFVKDAALTATEVSLLFAYGHGAG